MESPYGPMSGDDGSDDPEYHEPRVPAALRARVDALFLAYRGYESASFQESLSVIADLAADRIEDPERSGPDPAADLDAPGDASPSTPVTGDSAATDDATGSAGEPAFGDAVDFDEYVDGLQAGEAGTAATVESVLDTEHVDGLVQELAAEVLDEMTDDAFEELEHGVDQGVGAGVTDGMGATEAVGGTTAPSGSTGDGVPASLTADPESDCARCGRPHRVSVLQTRILEEDGSVVLVCPSCAD